MDFYLLTFLLFVSYWKAIRASPHGRQCGPGLKLSQSARATYLATTELSSFRKGAGMKAAAPLRGFY
jgi:hypothetical protein